MWIPPDIGKQYMRELERKQHEEAYLREGRSGQPSYLLRRRLGIGQKIIVAVVAMVGIVVFLIILSTIITPTPAS